MRKSVSYLTETRLLISETGNQAYEMAQHLTNQVNDLISYSPEEIRLDQAAHFNPAMDEAIKQAQDLVKQLKSLRMHAKEIQRMF